MKNHKLQIAPARHGWRFALGLFFASPLIGEFLLGNLPITMLWVLLVLAPLYGGGALLIREVARRFRLGWAGILLLGLAYAIVEEAYTTQSLFNPNYLGLRLLDFGYVPALGMSVWWSAFVLGIHLVWSIATPIALMEALSGPRRRQPWLGKLGLGVAIGLFALGCFAAGSHQLQEDPFRASLGQVIGSAAAIVLLVVCAFAVGRRIAANPARPVGGAPGPNGLFAAGLLLGSAFMTLATRHGALPAGFVASGLLGLFALGAYLLRRWSLSPSWNAERETAFAGGTLMTYAWWGFVQPPSVGDISATTDLIGNCVFSAAAVAFLWLSWRSAKRNVSV